MQVEFSSLVKRTEFSFLWGYLNSLNTLSSKKIYYLRQYTIIYLRYKSMKPLLTTILTLLVITAQSQRIKKKDIVFTTMEETIEAVDRLNDLRTTPGLAEQATGIDLPDNIVMSELEVDTFLTELAKKRVTEMIKNQKLSHMTKIKKRNMAESICWNYQFSLDGSINQFIIDRGDKYFGHRKMILYKTLYTKIGYAGGWYDGKFWTCILME